MVNVGRFINIFLGTDYIGLLTGSFIALHLYYYISIIPSTHMIICIKLGNLHTNHNLLLRKGGRDLDFWQ